MDLHKLFGGPTHLAANPDRYDYIHSLQIEAGGAVELVDGGCQALRRRILGHLSVLSVAGDQAEVRFHSLRDVDPYKRSPEVKPIPDLDLKVQVEVGPFLLRCEVVWNVTEDDEPWLICPVRLAFAQDPLSAGMRRIEWPPEALTDPEVRAYIEKYCSGEEKTRRYYPAPYTEVTRRELVSRGLLSLPASDV